MQYIIPLLLIAGTIYLVIKLRKKPLAETPAEWDEILEKNVRFYQRLKPNQKVIFKDEMLNFINEVYIEGVDFEIAEIDRVFVAASAIIPVFHFRNWRYTNITGVIIYPDNFNQQLGYEMNVDDRWISGMVGNGKYENQMILSRKALHHGFNNKTDKHNTAIHEFVHLLDKSDGEMDGIPSNFIGQEYVLPWVNLMHKEMEKINANKSDIRSYGGTSQIEFFTVVSEYFFERPNLLKRKHPELYKMLEMCFNKKNLPQ